MKSTLLIFVTSIAVSAELMGCSAIHTKTPEGRAIVMDRKHFADYVEQVFRHHNSVADQLLYVADAGESHDGQLDRAEARMSSACLPLNELVSASTGGQRGSFWSRVHLSESVPECEAATRSVEQLISSAH